MYFLTQLRVIMAFHGKVETQLGQVEYNHSAPQTLWCRVIYHIISISYYNFIV